MARRRVSNDAIVADVTGWILICKEDGGWHIAWIEPFTTKKSALEFAKDACWPRSYRAVRGRLMADPQ